MLSQQVEMEHLVQKGILQNSGKNHKNTQEEIPNNHRLDGAKTL